MFGNTRKKQLRNRVIAAAVGVFVMTFGIWLNYNDNEKQEDTEEAVKNVAIDKTESTKKTDETNEIKEGTDTKSEPISYLIKEENDVVKVFICDEDDKKELYLITSIPFELLSESDQQLFEEGVYIDTEEDLGKFLENFDS